MSKKYNLPLILALHDFHDLHGVMPMILNEQHKQVILDNHFKEFPDEEVY